MRSIIIISLLLTISINIVMAQNYPMSDPENSQGWILNEHMSDEFNGEEINRDKWWILGEDINGKREYRSKWKGRAHGQFVGHNVFF